MKGCCLIKYYSMSVQMEIIIYLQNPKNQLRVKFFRECFMFHTPKSHKIPKLHINGRTKLIEFLLQSIF